MLEHIKNRIKNRQWFKNIVESKLNPNQSYEAVESRELEYQFYFYVKEDMLAYTAHDDATPCVIESSGRCKICGL